MTDTHQLDPVLLAHEADQAWAAYENCLRSLTITQNLLRAREEVAVKRAPVLAGFERAASRVYAWLGGTVTAEEAMAQIAEDVRQAREGNAPVKVRWGKR